MTKEEEFEQKVAAAEGDAIEKYKAELKAKGKSAPSTVAVFRAAFRAGIEWATKPVENAAEPVNDVEA